MAHLRGLGLAELPAPIPHRLLGEDDAACSHERVDIAVAQAAAEVQPDTMTDDLCREPMALVGVGGGSCVHEAIMPWLAEAGEVIGFI